MEVCTVHVWSACRDKKRLMEALEPRLQIVWSFCVDTASWTRALCKSSQYPQHLYTSYITNDEKYLGLPGPAQQVEMASICDPYTKPFSGFDTVKSLVSKTAISSYCIQTRRFCQGCFYIEQDQRAASLNVPLATACESLSLILPGRLGHAPGEFCAAASAFP